jgi:hypothetical protein
VALGGVFDVVLCHGLLDRVPDPGPVLWTLRRLVAVNGAVLATVRHHALGTGAVRRTNTDYTLSFERSGLELVSLTETARYDQWVDGRVTRFPHLRVFELRPEPATGPKRTRSPVDA